MNDANAALIGFLGVLAGGYVNNFIGEDFRRFRDAQAFAGALAGELKSHGTAVPLLRTGFTTMLQAVKAGQKLNLQGFIPSRSPVFDSGVTKLGLLGPELAEEVAFIYEQIRAFRLTFQRVSKYPDMLTEQLESTLTFCIDLINVTDIRGKALTNDLKKFAAQGYWKSRCWFPCHTPTPGNTGYR